MTDSSKGSVRQTPSRIAFGGGAAAAAGGE